jgi:LysR family nitrogen assimilation transcriptional regulator
MRTDQIFGRVSSAMDVRQLRYFVRIIDLKSFTKAAEALRVSQPALGLCVRHLEDELKTQLLVRHSRGVEPTPAGELLVERARRIIHELDDARQTVRDLAGLGEGTIRVGITPSTNASLAVSLIRRCATELPGTRIVIYEALSADLVEWTQSHRIDIALVYYVENVPKDLVREELGIEDLAFVQSARSADGKGSISFSEVARHPLILPSAPHGLRILAEACAARHGIKLNIPFEMQAISVIAELVEDGVASCILPLGGIAGRIADRRLVARRMVRPRLSRNISLIRSNRRPLSLAERRLSDLIGDIVKRKRVAEKDLWNPR